MPEEIRFFLRTAVFGLAIAVVYWFRSYDAVGTVMLGGFGVAGAFLAVVFVRSLRARGWHPTGRLSAWLGLGDTAGSPLGGEPTRYPAPGCAPIACGLGLALVALGAVYGPPPVLVAAPFLAFGGWTWLMAAVAEYRAVATDEETTPADPVPRERDTDPAAT